MDVEKLKAILAALQGSEVTRLDWTNGQERLTLRMGHPPAPVTALHAVPAAQPGPPPLPTPPQLPPLAPPPSSAAPAAAPPPPAHTSTAHSPPAPTSYPPAP